VIPDFSKMSGPGYDPCGSSSSSSSSSRYLAEESKYVAGYLGPNLEYLNWSGGEYLYALALITTVGYGVFVPTTVEGRYFSIVYSFLGFCLVGFCFGKSTGLIDDIAKAAIKKGGCYRNSSAKQKLAQRGDGESSTFQVKARFVSDDANDDELEEEGDLGVQLLIFHTVLTFGWLLIMAQWFQTHERWETFLDGFYFAFVTSTTVGFGDFAPDLTKLWASTFIFMLVGLLLMATWLGAAGDVFFQVVSCGASGIKHALHTPMHAVGDRMNKLDQAEEAASKVEPITSDHKTAPTKSALTLRAKCCQSSLLWSCVVLILVMGVGALCLRELEWETAKTSAVEWHTAYNAMVAEFEAHENITQVSGSSMKEDVEAALQLLNSMGTCGAPPSEEQDMDWTFKAAMLYTFYICTTIGYGDMNVATQNGKIFVIVYACIGIWVFGWASTKVSDIIEKTNSRVAQKVYNKWRDATNRRAMQKQHIEPTAGNKQREAARKKELKEAFGKMDESGDGEIDVNELNGLAKSLGVSFDDDDLGKVSVSFNTPSTMCDQI